MSAYCPDTALYLRHSTVVFKEGNGIVEGDTCRETVSYAKVTADGYAFAGVVRSGCLQMHRPVGYKVLWHAINAVAQGQPKSNLITARATRPSYERVLIGVAAYAGLGIVPHRAFKGCSLDWTTVS
ncbi:hypothetical protein BO78DRAFT_107747 [Aspergillus sclerotiicarbonarius CBS 121057]|uniref:Uncharacterized protein n=1 Tax=Aspergillus sclerotiicarbonarius (strain CBS 121057 / IBT 28362) TaxID=1448318 RepID=A0A319E9M7_ASPSB|nr:hypothetical protein BO78DRAFT_107747 [Aspergillus sclerotiicarbonarius CBS 121057]